MKSHGTPMGLWVALALLLPATAAAAEAGIDPVTEQRAAELDREFRTLLDRYRLHTAGVGVIHDGKLAWTGYYGEQSPGVPASRETLFNIASMTKAVSAEAVLRLVERGRLSLDEPMASYWVDPDLEGDPRHRELTARMALTHTTGLPNWRFFSADRVLRFIHDPGTRFGYSGEGFEYLMRYAEEKLGIAFDKLVAKQVFEPAGMDDSAFSVQPDKFQRIARPMDDEGKFHGYYCRPNGWCWKEGDYSAADEMVATVEDYARFLLWAMAGEGLSQDLQAERHRVHLDLGSDGAIKCSESGACPKAEGYGLGWHVIDYGDYQIVGHGGSDWAEVAQGYYYTHSNDGLVIFLNGPTTPALAAMAEAIALVDPDSPMVGHYRWRHERAASP